MTNAYVTNANSTTVSVINTATNTISTTITVGTYPRGAAVTPDGTKALITNQNPGTTGTVSIINTTTNTVSYTLNVGDQPYGVAIKPDGTKAYVTNNTDGTVSVIDLTQTPPVVKTGSGYPITVGTAPAGVVFSLDGTTAYVANQNNGVSDGTVSVINAATDAVSATVTGLGLDPTGIAITPDGTKVYVTNANDTSNSVAVISTATNTVTSTLTGFNGPEGVAVSPDGTKVYVTNDNGLSNGTVSVINPATNAVISTITVGVGPVGIAFTPDGTTAYVANGSPDSISVINTASNTVIATIANGSGIEPFALGQFIQPANNRPVANFYTAPQGRLTLTSNEPVMTGDVTGATSIYYTPYQGNVVSIYNGAFMQSYAFSQLTMTLNSSNQTSGNIYDMFAFLNANNQVTIGAGPAWSSTTSRGTGSGTTQLQQTDGLWTNANSITLTNGSASYGGIPAGQATYLGSFYATANGQTAMQFQPAAASGGGNPYLALYNAYNRVTVASRNIDSTTYWLYTGGLRAANGSSHNCINWLDGLQQSFVRAEYNIQGNPTSGNAAYVFIGLDSTSAGLPSSGISAFNINVNMHASSTIPPQLGLHTVYALEESGGGSGAYFYANNNVMALTAVLEM